MRYVVYIVWFFLWANWCELMCWEESLEHQLALCSLLQLELLFTIPMCLGPVFDPVVFNGEQMDSAELSSPAENCGMCASGEPYLFLMSKGEGDHVQKTSGAFGVRPAGRKDVPGPDKGRTVCRSQLRAAWALWPAARSASDREKSQWNTPPRPHMQGCLINDK